MNSSPNADAKPPESSFVLDASALIASVMREPGAEAVDAVMRSGACASTVNEAEVVSRLIDLGFTDKDAEDALRDLEYVSVEFTGDHALHSGRIRLATRPFGLGLGDRACLALAATLGLPVMTADRIWTQLDLSIEVVLCR